MLLCSNNSSDMGQRRAKAVQVLLSLEDSAKVLHVHHFLRFQIGMEALAAGVGATLTTELSSRLMGLSRSVCERAEAVCPGGWPLVTGLRMHYIYSYGRHCIGIGRPLTVASLVEGMLAVTAAVGGHSVDSNNINNQSDPETPPFLLIARYLYRSVHEHIILRDEGTAMETFMGRYCPELSAIGITCVADLEEAVRVASNVIGI
eukprot:Tbor_TRINITY_DN5899_c1_g1::TRINITY_DN5899_c1_g1_i1::g.6558::m.6558